MQFKYPGPLEAIPSDVTFRKITTRQYDAVKVTLQWYAKQFCEGFCEEFPNKKYYEPAMDKDCAGCKARATLAALKDQEHG